VSDSERAHDNPAVASPALDEPPDSSALVGALFEAKEQLRLTREREDALVDRTLTAERRMWQAIDAHRAMEAEIDRIERSRFFRIASIGWDLLKKIRRIRDAVEAPLRRNKNAAEPEPPPAAERPPLPDAKDVAEILADDFGKGPGREVARRFSHLRHEDNTHYFRALVRHLQSLKDDPCLPMYFEFAISCNERGERVARILGSRMPLWRKRLLDIGCAYGGFLVAFARRGADVTGIDLDEHLLRLARANFRDHEMEAPLLRADVTVREDVAELGTFDLITANDVLEHVENPEETIRNLEHLLRPGGAAYLEIPNRHFPDFVRQDGHYQLFGITLLEREDARRYYALHAPGTPYGVGHYLDLEEYLGMLDRAGLKAELVRDPEEGDAVSRAVSVAREIRRDAPALLAAVPEPMRPTIADKVEAYCDRLEKTPRRGWNARSDFLLRYGTAFWRILARKPEAGLEA
jgi:2-polyprenyl-3-methyl-5-hydroxy-6-metoxy-1,4-benzoquinol methylase